MINCIILGGGQHAKVCIEILENKEEFNIVGIVDSNKNSESYKKYGYFILDIDEDWLLSHTYKTSYFSNFQDISIVVKNLVIGFGSILKSVKRQNTFEKFKKAGYNFPNIIHDKSSIENSVEMGEGNQIMAGAIISSDAKLGNNCIINSGAIVSHNCLLGDNVHLTPGVILAGSVSIGNNSLIGMGVTVANNIKIGENVIINNGCNIYTDVPDNSHVKLQQGSLSFISKRKI